MTKLICGLGVGLALSNFGIAAEKDEEIIESVLKAEIGKRFPNATIEFLDGSTFPTSKEGVNFGGVRVLSESGTGTADYSVNYSDGSKTLGQARFTANVPTFIATRRVRPGERLVRSDFQIQPVNVAQGLAYQYRGVMMNAKETIDGLQARQTILEGQYPLSNGIEKVPDIRRGDTVQVKIMSGDISLMTMAIVQEPGYRDQRVRVLTQKTKKELVGQLKDGGIVEVAL